MSYLTATCLAPRVSERFAGSTAESRTGELAGAGIRLLNGTKDTSTFVGAKEDLLNRSGRPLTGAEDEIQQLAEDQVQG